MQAIPVYLINLDRRPDRLAFMADQLDAMGIAWERVSAVDAESVSDAEIEAAFATEPPLIRMGRGSQCCTLSHIQLLRRVASQDARGALILEDDVELSPDLPAFVRKASWLPERVGIVRFEKWSRRSTSKLLGRSLGRAPVPGRSMHRLHSRIGGAGCQIVTPAAARRLLREVGRLRFPIDHLLYNAGVSAAAREIATVLVLPALARQRWDALGSDIAASLKPQSRPVSMRLRRGWAEIRPLPHQIRAILFEGARMRPVKYSERTA